MKIIRILLCLSCLLLFCFPALSEAPAQPIDYAGQLRLDMGSGTVKTEVTVKTFIDGDTTHFYVPKSVSPTGVLKARYLAVNTPEITGKVEEYGKKAAAFTKEKLLSAESILIESDDAKWNLDSTGDRHLVFVWYKPEGESEYRCLNVELLQNGLAIANSTANNRYGSTCTAALSQARAQKLSIYSGEKDPDFYYGSAVELTLRELRTNPEAYNGMKVAFSGVITFNRDQSVYVEDVDEETGLVFGMSVYYGHGMSGAGLDILSVGNEARIVGTLQYYEAGGTWQVSGLTYRMMKPNDPGNIQKLSDGHSPVFLPVEADMFAFGSVMLESGGEQRSLPLAQALLDASIQMDSLLVTGAHASEDGALTLTCESGDAAIRVRTQPLYENGALITPDRYLNQTIAVRGVVEWYDGTVQIRVFSPDHIATD